MHLAVTLYSDYTSLTERTTDGYNRGMVKTLSLYKIGGCEGEKAAQYRNVKNSHGRRMRLYVYITFTV